MRVGLFFFKAHTNVSYLKQQWQKSTNMCVPKEFAVFFKTYMDAVTFINTPLVAVMNPAAFLCDSFETPDDSQMHSNQMSPYRCQLWIFYFYFFTLLASTLFLKPGILYRNILSNIRLLFILFYFFKRTEFCGACDSFRREPLWRRDGCAATQRTTSREWGGLATACAAC